MRQSRAPTASQLENPPPPSSSTKSGRFFGKGSLGEYTTSYKHNEGKTMDPFNSIPSTGFSLLS
jgi:hypothetical protein